jgi:REP element-mobilizing transposase RayT
MARGNRREAVFLDAQDYAWYLHRLAQYRREYGVTIHGYCLMPNHVHLVVRTGVEPLDRFMQGLQQSYTQHYNRRHEQVGHVFQGRYKALLCGTDEYLVTLVRYVHLNPVRAALVTHASDYPFSAHHAYLTGVATDLVDPTPVLRLLGGSQAYSRLVEEGAATQPDVPAGSAFESGAPPSALPRRPPTKRSEPFAPVDLALNRLAAQLDIGVDALRGPDRSRSVSRARALAAFVLVRRLGYRVTEVSTALGRDGTTMTIIVGRLGRRLAADPEGAQEVERLGRCMEVKA